MTAREQIEKEANEIAKDFKEFADHPRLDEILRGEWIHDSSLPVPSVKLIVFLGAVLLRDGELLDELSELEIEPGEALVIEKIKSTKIEKIAFLATLEAKRRVTASYSFPNENTQRLRHEWENFMWHFREPESPMHRIIAHRCIQMLTTRSIWEGDHEMLGSLALATEEHYMRIWAKNAPLRDTISNILYWFDEVKHHINRPPSKTDMKEFIEVYYDNAEHAKANRHTWSKAYTITGLFSDDRRGKRDKAGIQDLAKKLRKQK